jgi:hypothetical protein
MFFNDNKSAFVLKPANMRALKIMVDEPKEQNPALSYATRTITSPFYKLDV